MTEQGFRQLVCQCGEAFQGVTENDALGRMRQHIENARAVDETLHWQVEAGYKKGTEVMAMTFAELRAEFERLMDTRSKAQDPEKRLYWGYGDEAQLYRTGMRLMAEALHHNLHTDEADIRNCRSWTCLYTSMALPEIEEVQWR